MKTYTLEEIKKVFGENIEPIYKDESYEPYIGVANGILGDILYDSIEDKIKCHECSIDSPLFKRINFTHLRSVHQYNGDNPVLDYKLKYGLGSKTPLCSKETSRKLSNSAINNQKFLQNIRRIKNIKKGDREKKTRFRSTNAMYRNKTNTCLAQMKKRFIILQEIVKRVPSANDSRKYDRGLLEYCINHYGGWNKGKKVFGIPTYDHHDGGKQTYDNDFLIGNLRKFYILNGGGPKRGQEKIGEVHRATYFRRFGSWRRAKLVAGLDQLL